MQRVDMGGILKNMFSRSHVGNFLGNSASELKSLFFDSSDLTTIQNELMGGDDREKANDCANGEERIVTKYGVQLFP